ncbi:MAG: ribosome biogenesis GTPase YlqF, partial [Ruminococcus sp.]|nr:ribosome biogenesis GTPase YlqF [Ruminococcus sp.]
NWYPGHMAKSRRLLQDQLSRVDAVIELCDARIPGASRNPDLNALITGKPRLVVLNKADLANAEVTRNWLAWLRLKGQSAMSYNGLRGNARPVLEQIAQMTKEKVEHLAARGVKKTVRVMVVGIPNVGKSTFINRITGGKTAKTGDRPGVTRANQWIKAGQYLEILDTPGLLWPRLEDQADAHLLALIGTINDQILDRAMLSVELLERIKAENKAVVEDRFHIKNIEVSGVELLEEACRGRGWILPKGEVDWDRGAAVILDEFRAGKLGPVSLQLPPQE